MTSFTVIDCNGDAIERHLTAADAAAIILNHDGGDYEIRTGEACTGMLAGQHVYELWTRKQVANRPWTRTVVSVIEATLAEAEAAIYAAVIAAHWPRHPEAILDAQYDELTAEAARDA